MANETCPVGAATAAFQVRDLVQLRYEYEVQRNPSCFRIVEIRGAQAVLGQLSPDGDGYVGCDTVIDLGDPDLIRPHPEILEMYARHVDAHWDPAVVTDWDFTVGFNEFGDCTGCNETVDYCRCEARLR